MGVFEGLRRVVGVAGIGLLLLASCGSDGGVTVPNTEELDAAVLALDDLGDGWTDYRHGVISERERELTPSLELCPEAGEEDIRTVSGIVWQVFAHANRPLDDPDAFPLNLQQYLLAAELDDAESMFAAMRDGTAVCFGQGPTITEDGETLSATPMALPEIGDEAFGYEVVVGEPTGLRWDIREVVVRKGPVLMWIQEIEIVEGDHVLTIEDIGDLALQAASRLP